MRRAVLRICGCASPALAGGDGLATSPLSALSHVSMRVGAFVVLLVIAAPVAAQPRAQEEQAARQPARRASPYETGRAWNGGGSSAAPRRR